MLASSVAGCTRRARGIEVLTMTEQEAQQRVTEIFGKLAARSRVRHRAPALRGGALRAESHPEPATHSGPCGGGRECQDSVAPTIARVASSMSVGLTMLLVVGRRATWALLAHVVHCKFFVLENTSIESRRGVLASLLRSKLESSLYFDPQARSHHRFEMLRRRKKHHQRRWKAGRLSLRWTTDEKRSDRRDPRRR